MNKAYKKARDTIMKALEEIPNTRGTTAGEYHAALEDIKAEVEEWFDASIDAAKGDIQRERGR